MSKEILILTTLIMGTMLLSGLGNSILSTHQVATPKAYAQTDRIVGDLLTRFGINSDNQEEGEDPADNQEEGEDPADNQEEGEDPADNQEGDSDQNEISQTMSGEANHFRMYWTTTRCSNVDGCNEMRDFANSVLDGADYVIFHYGSGQTPQKYQIDALKDVTSVGVARKGFEFFSLAELQRHAPTAKANGFGFISYDLERGMSPASEVNDPLNSVRKARSIANDNGLYLQLAPSNAISRGQYADDIGKITNRYHLQSQIMQDDDTTCARMDSWVDGRVKVLEGAKPILEGKITFQVTLNPNLAADGKTIFQTAKDCIDRIANDDVDGLSIWWTASSWDDETYQDLVRYYERTYS